MPLVGSSTAGNTPQEFNSNAGMVGRPPTYGEKAVGLTFNPSGDARVNKIKQMYANIIDELAGPSGENMGSNGEVGLAGRFLGRAVNDAITAQMWAVKAITYKD